MTHKHCEDEYAKLWQMYGELEDERDRLRDAALAYQELSTCYLIGKRTTEKLFARLEKARAALQEAEHGES